MVAQPCPIYVCWAAHPAHIPGPTAGLHNPHSSICVSNKGALAAFDSNGSVLPPTSGFKDHASGTAMLDSISTMAGSPRSVFDSSVSAVPHHDQHSGCP
eukprot:3219964-Pyramimonas_sp.AAC.1